MSFARRRSNTDMARIKSLKWKNRKIGLNIIIMTIMILYILPLWYILNNAFKIRKYISQQPFWVTREMFTFNNIIEAFTKMEYMSSFKNSVIVVAFTCVMLVVFGSLAGFGITYARNKTLDGVYLAYIALISLPLQIAMVPLIVLMRQLNLTDTHIAMALIYNAIYLPFVVFLYTGFMRSIPRDLIEAAKIDGCNPFSIYIRIFMPLLTTTTGVVVILRGVSTWNDLFVPLIVVNKPSMYTLPMKLYFFASSRQGQWHIVFGATFLCIIPIMVLFLVMQKTFIKGIMSGSLKG